MKVFLSVSIILKKRFKPFTRQNEQMVLLIKYINKEDEIIEWRTLLIKSTSFQRERRLQNEPSEISPSKYFGPRQLEMERGLLLYCTVQYMDLEVFKFTNIYVVAWLDILSNSCHQRRDLWWGLEPKQLSSSQCRKYQFELSLISRHFRHSLALSETLLRMLRIYNVRKWKVVVDIFCFFRIHDRKLKKTQKRFFQYLLIDVLEKAIWKKIHLICPEHVQQETEKCLNS